MSAPVAVADMPAAAGLTGLEQLRTVVRREIPPPPMAETMNLDLVEVGEGRAVFEGTPGDEHYNPLGTVHGGWAATLLDSALGCAVHSTLAPGVGYTSLTLEVKFTRPITRETGTVRCVAEVEYRGRRQATATARIVDAAGRVLAHGTSTCMILT